MPLIYWYIDEFDACRSLIDSSMIYVGLSLGAIWLTWISKNKLFLSRLVVITLILDSSTNRVKGGGLLWVQHTVSIFGISADCAMISNKMSWDMIKPVMQQENEQVFCE